MFRDAKSYGWIRDGDGLSHEPAESSITSSLKCNVVTRTSARGHDDGALVHGSSRSAAANLALRRYLWTHHGHSRQLDPGTNAHLIKLKLQLRIEYTVLFSRPFLVLLLRYRVLRFPISRSSAAAVSAIIVSALLPPPAAASASSSLSGRRLVMDEGLQCKNKLLTTTTRNIRQS